MLKSTARFEHGIEIPARVGGDVMLDGRHAARTAFEDSVCYAYPLLSCGRACLVGALSGHAAQRHAHKAGDGIGRRRGLASAAAGASNVAELVAPAAQPHAPWSAPASGAQGSGSVAFAPRPTPHVLATVGWK